MANKTNRLTGGSPRFGTKWVKLLYAGTIVIILVGLSSSFLPSVASAAGCPSSPYPSGASGVQYDICLVGGGGGQLSDTSGYAVKVQQTIGSSTNTLDTTYRNGQYFTTSNPQGGVGQPIANCNGNQALPYHLTVLVSKSGSTYTTNYSACNDQASFGYVIPVTVSASTNVGQTGKLIGCISYTAPDGSTQHFDGSTNSQGSPATATIKGPSGANSQTITPGIDQNGCLYGSTLNAMAAGDYTLTANYAPGQTPQGFVSTLVYSKSFTIKSGATTDITGKASSAAATGSGSQTAASPPACESSGFNLSWIVCPVINAVSDAEQDIINDLINPMLKTPPLQLYDSGNGTAYDNIYKVWSQFRIYGDVILLIALLVAIFSEALGGGLVDAYTVRKILPRILAAAILINLSIYIVAGLEDITNILGAGVYEIISAPFKASGSWNITLNGLGADFSGFAGLVAVGAGIWAATHASALTFLLLFIALPVILVFFGIVVTLLIRQAILAFCIISSPIAFALYCLPNTEQYFRKWFDLLLKTLMVYPIVELVFVMSGVAGVLVSSVGGWAGQLLGVVAKLAPLALIPFAFKMSGSVIGQVYAGAANVGKRVTEGIKGNQNDPYSLRNRQKRGVMEDVTRAQQRAVDRGDPIGAPRRRRALARVVAMTGGNIEGRMSRYNKEQAEIAESMSATGRDRYRYAGAGYILEAGEADVNGVSTNSRRFMNSKGKEISANEYQKGKSLFGNSLGAIGSQLEYTTRKAQSDEDVANMRFAFAKNAKADKWNGNEMVDVWAQATFPHKDKWLSEWYSTPVPLAGNNAGGGVRFQDVSSNMTSMDKAVNEQHRSKESFRVGSLRAQDWAAQNAIMMDHQAKIDAGTATQDEINRYAKISENLDTMARSGIMTVSGEGEVQVAGASAEAQGLIGAMYNSRKYVAAPRDVSVAPGAPGPAAGQEYSSSERVLYGRAQADQLMATGLDRQTAIQRSARPGIVANVASDRGPIINNTTVT